MKSRFFLHPVLLSRKGRWLMMLLVVITTSTVLLIGHKFNQTLLQVGIHSLPQTPDINSVVLFLQTFSTKLFILLLSAVFASSLINREIMGPLKRIEQWLKDWEQGKDVGPLHSRTGEIYENLIELLNTFRETYKSK